MDSRLTAQQRLALALLWLAMLLVAGLAIGQRLQVTGDLRKFMPRQAGIRFAAWLQAVATADGTRLRVPRTRGAAWAAH
ncbi:hypothetical protein MQC88_10780 [Luteimonas sp. 50]|uniref:Uncharacterized protein n=1 Tax=Cognatiluteimonas sedimenti TaxID=2927791 RepID=A0ABT0A610_9GAMM|nr:hypothetical protein [Lysobacter sedimenti]MCJ0826428.1 hypothetical protein [Lysobacter sedimenti]